MRKKMRKKGYTLVEMLVAMIIVAIVAGALFSVLSVFYGARNQAEDYSAARKTLENAFRAMGPVFTNVGLGVDLKGGNFAAAFWDDAQDNRPVMAYMGDTKRANMDWGGPVTISNGDITQGDANLVTAKTGGSYVGTEVYLYRGVPSGRFLSPDEGTGLPLMEQPPVSRSTPSEIDFSQYADFGVYEKTVGYWNISGDVFSVPYFGTGGVKALLNEFKNADGFALGVPLRGRVSPSSTWAWFLIPTFGVPLRLVPDGYTKVRPSFTLSSPFSFLYAQIAPGAVSTRFPPAKRVVMGGALRGFEEIHISRLDRIRLNDGNLEQIYYVSPTETQSRVIARDIAAVCFQYNPETSLLTATIAARGNDPSPSGYEGGVPPGWPTFAPVDRYFKDKSDLRRRLLVESMTWLVRN